MRTVSFRDDVLWAIAYKLGYDPETNLQKNQAYAYSTYINSWVRRLWDISDWPEWVDITTAAPDTGHYVSWDIPVPGPSDSIPVLQIGKVLKVYLTDPRLTWTPVETPFRLYGRGIHVGFEHGPLVWIKFLPRCPQFTAREWDNGNTYNLDDLTYSPSSGECYRSKTSNNRGHDPVGGQEQVLLVEETPGIASNPGSPAATGIVDVFVSPTVYVTDPPVAGTTFKVQVLDVNGAVLYTASVIASGTNSLAAIAGLLETQLDAASALSSFTISLIGSTGFRLEDNSGFSVNATLITTRAVTYPLTVVQVQAYSLGSPPVPGQPQQLRLSIVDAQVFPGGTYQLTFTTVDNVEHEAVYIASSTDRAQQVLSGLIDSVIDMQATDPFFAGVTSSLDTVSPSATFTISPTLGTVSLNAVVIPPGAVYWELVPFPFALVDQVIRGVIADARGEQGQTDKQGAEEQVVPAETKLRLAAQTGNDYDPLSDQQRPHSRYSVK